MITHELHGSAEYGYNLYKRTWSGGSGTPDFELLAKLTAEEASCLMGVDYFSETVLQEKLPITDINPRGLLKLESIMCGGIERERLVVTLPVVAGFRNKPLEFVDPWWCTHQAGGISEIRKLWLEQFRVMKPEKLQAWADNPVESVGSW